MTPDNTLQLHDIHLPDSANIWPLAFGWWILLFVLLVALTLIIRSYLRRLQLKKQKAIVVSELDNIIKQLRKTPSNKSLSQVNTLLRQLAVIHYPRSEIASLTGSKWISFLDQSGSTHDFSKGAGRILIEAPYRSGKPDNLNIEEFISLIRSWVNIMIEKNFKASNWKIL